MESLPLMLQVALLLLSCVLSRYLWNANIAVASVVIGLTSLGALFYFSIVIAGAVSQSCPYQTPGPNILRYVVHKIPSEPYPSAPTIRNTFMKSRFLDTIVTNIRYHRPCSRRGRVAPFLGDLVHEVPIAFGTDIYSLGRVVIQAPAGLLVEAYRLVRAAPD